MSERSGAVGEAAAGTATAGALLLRGPLPAQPRQHLRPRAVPPRGGVEHDAASERVGRRVPPDHDAVAVAGEHRELQPQLPELLVKRGDPAALCRVPWWTCTRSPCSRVAHVSAQSSTSRRRARPARSTSPRADVAAAHAARLTATRCPASAVATVRAVDLHATHAHRACRRATTSSRSPSCSLPHQSVPVTTVPRPSTVNSGRRGAPAARAVPRAARATRDASASSAATSVVQPRAGARVDTATISTSPSNSRTPRPARAGIGDIGLRDRDDAVARRRARAAPPRAQRLRHHAVVGRDHEEEQRRSPSHRRPSCARTAHARARRRPTAAGPTAAQAARSRARSSVPRACSSGRRSASTSGERLDQRRLAVIDVPGRAEDERRAHRCMETERRRSRTFPARLARRRRL